MKKSTAQLKINKEKKVLISKCNEEFLVKLSIIFLLIVSFCNIVKAQSNVNDAYIITQESTNNKVKCTFTVVLNDTINVDKVEFLLGTEKNGSDLISFVVDVNTGAGISNDWTLEKNTNAITITGGDVSFRTTYYGQAKARLNGTWGTPFYFIAN